VKKLLATLLLILLAVIGLAMHKRSRSTHRRAAFAQVQKGQAEATVLAAMGQPDQVATFVPHLWWEGSYVGPNRGVATKEYQYAAFPIGEWVIGFDAAGTVVSKYYKQSP